MVITQEDVDSLKSQLSKLANSVSNSELRAVELAAYYSLKLILDAIKADSGLS